MPEPIKQRIFPGVTPPAEARRIWCEDLESGRWKQAKGALRNREGYCCLGVGESLCGVRISPETARGAMSPRVAAAFGLRTTGGHYRRTHVRRSLYGDNDNGKTFPEIAAIIRSEPAGLLAEETPSA